MNEVNQFETEEVTPLQLIEFIYAKGNDLKTDSRKVAIAFDKEHKHVMRDIRELFKEEPEFAKSNFGLCYENSNLQNGKPQPYYEMTKDGFIFLVMGFSGAKARKTKIAYIGAFNLMQGDINIINNGLIEQLMNRYAVERASQRMGSLGSLLMHKRKHDKKINYLEIAEIKAQIQPDLFDNLLN